MSFCSPQESSNSYASGANQNSGNVLTDRRTTRVAAPPGGRSTISLGWEQPQPQARERASSVPQVSHAAEAAYSGSRTPRSGSNAFATGSNQNCHNVLTDRRTTRVAAPPGGASSFSLGWHADNSQYARPTRSSSSSALRPAWGENDRAGQRGGGYNAPRIEREACGDATPQKQSTSRNHSSARTPAVSEAGGYTGGAEFGFGNFSVPVYDAPSEPMSRCSSAPRFRPKNDVEGAQPRKWKPAKAPRAAPGERPSFNRAAEGESRPEFGRKRFSDVGASQNRDPTRMEALRFFQDEERLGKMPGAKYKYAPTQRDADSHRYYLAADGKNMKPGKGRSPFHDAKQADCGRRGSLISASTSAGTSADNVSECDSLPLGAEWNSYHE